MFLTAILIFLFGACIGSFLNVIICRVPERKSIIRNRSHCPQCKEFIKWYDLLPILSFFILRGRCRKCKKKISWQYPLVEFFTAMAFVFIAWHFDFVLANPFLYRDLIFVATLIIVFVTDWRFYLILDAVIWPMIVFSLIFNIFFFSNSENILYHVMMFVGAALLAGGFFLLQYLVSRGKWIGFGDIKLGLLMGAMLGWPSVLVALYFAYVLGAIMMLILMVLKKKKRKEQVAFGTFLSVGTVVAIFYGEQIITWYLTRL
jgi:prepilin signal peptidase PulO-like enzyme (type II secretory pathway)